MDVPGFAPVTSAPIGVGKACAKTFIKDEAARVALFDLEEEAFLASKVEIENENAERDCEFCQIDVCSLDATNEALVTETVDKASQKLGQLDYVVSAAEIVFKHQGGAAFANTKDWQKR